MIFVKVREYKKRGVKAWEADITIHFPDGFPPHRVRKKSPMNTAKQAYAWGMSLGQSLAQKGRPGSTPVSPPPSPKVITFEAFAPIYLERWVLDEGLAKSTYRLRERQIIRYFLPLLGPLLLTDITSEHIAKVKSSLRKTAWNTVRGASNKNTILAVLCHMLEMAHEWGHLPTPPPKRPKWVKQPQPVVEIYTEEELTRLIEAAKAIGGGCYLMVLLGAEAGLRVGEMIGLRWEDIDLVERRMIVRQQESLAGEVDDPKSKAHRPIPLTDLLHHAFKIAQPIGIERVLYKQTKEGALPITRTRIVTWLKGAERRAKIISAKTPHKLRHSFASRLLKRGASLSAVQKLLGHTTLATTMMYLHLQPSEVEEAISRLSGDRPEKKDGGVGKSEEERKR